MFIRDIIIFLITTVMVFSDVSNVATALMQSLMCKIHMSNS